MSVTVRPARPDDAALIHGFVCELAAYEKLEDTVEATAEAVSSTIGGGSLPGEVLPSWAVVLTPAQDEDTDGLAKRLRVGEPGVFGRIERDRLYLDLRTVLPEDDEGLTGAIVASSPAKDGRQKPALPGLQDDRRGWPSALHVRHPFRERADRDRVRIAPHVRP